MNGTKLAPRSELVGIGLAISGAVAFGTLAIFAKQAYAQGAQAVPLLAVRFVLTALLLALYQKLRRRPIWIGRRKVVDLLFLGGLAYGVEATLFFLALERAPASVVGLVFYSYPMWTTLLAIGMKLERFDKRLLVALLLGTTGVASIFSISTTSPAGPLFALAAAVMVALFYIGAQILTEGVSSSVAATWTAAGAAVALSLLALVQGETLPSGAWAPAAGLGAATALAFIATYAAIALIGSSRTSIANMVELVTTIVLATLFLGESPTLRILIGAALVLSAIPVLAAKKREPIVAADTA